MVAGWPGARLVLGKGELEVGGLARAVAVGKGAGAPGAAAAHRRIAEHLGALRREGGFQEDTAAVLGADTACKASTGRQGEALFASS